MRLLVRSQIHRAFPELDHYPDEQCSRFVAAARRGWGTRLLHWPILAIAAAFGIIASLFLGGLAQHLAGGRKPDQFEGWLLAVFFGVFALTTLASLSAVYLLRDWLLLRRIRYILRARGSCANCQYNLIGLPVSAAHKVHCPECSMESSVDPALGELVTDNGGRPRYQPHESMLPRITWLSPQRRKKLIWRAVLVLTAIVLLLGAVAGSWEMSIRAQAARAAAAKPGPAALIKFVEDAQAADKVEGGPNAWDHFLAVNTAISAVSANFAKTVNLIDAEGNVIDADVSSLNGPPGNEDNLPESDRRKLELGRQYARKLMDAYRDGGVYDAMDKLWSVRWAVRPVNVAPGAPLITMLIPELGQARRLARINGARMHLAAQANDAAEFERALRANLALARIIKRQPVLIDYLVGVAIDGLSDARVFELLTRQPPPDAAMLGAIQRALDAEPAGVPPSHAFNGERLAMLDTIAWHFSDPAKVRMGKFSPGLQAITGLTGGPAPVGRLGSFEENRDAANAMFDRYVIAADTERWARADVSEDEPTGLVLMDILMPALSRSLQSVDSSELQRRGIRVIIAIERHRLAHGEYPRSLTDLVPSQLAVMPLDPYSGKPLGYRLVDPATDPQSRSYLLYSFGRDGQDNRGKAALNHMDALNSVSGAGTDFILNDGK